MKVTSIKKIKELAKRNKKRISKGAVEKVNSIIEDKIIEILKKSSKNAGLSGRNTIRKEDIE